MGNATNVASCRCFCSGEGQPNGVSTVEHSRPQRHESLWEDLRDPKQLAASSKGQIDMLTLELCLSGSGKLHADLQVLRLPEPALVVRSVDPDSELAKAVGDKPGICAGDRIVAVQGQAGAPAELYIMLHSLIETSGAASLSVRLRPPRFSVNMIRAGRYWQRLGLVVAVDRSQDLMVVLAVQEAGLIAEWNQQHNDRCVCTGDRIVATNGIDKNVVTMYTSILVTNLGGEIELQVQPPTRSAAPSLQAWVQHALDIGEIVEAL
mmetsp:Transcript_18977/g.44223  ORF Transcript_18977/g.44223 Transcript_18977/m.44223 type:complete len:264 (+) Transcript_18977:166-957(+)|eukprot:CAMPEP_0178412148 /NCGR_PEP_ID=MMETSP0689_2-20121128/21861_1 /TAXON_ID=160604 /ORGANISM="Amphidinium massartii, Strain CS-259" /LENGTH=263 /DNA_ID=CAMNT_0020033377 /DNA_START=91 /DNA_END=882 /DNA_ORIENTATION=+